MHQQDDCIFCKIIKGEAPAYVIHEDDLTLTFLDIFPSSRGHALIITKEHFANIFEADPLALAQVAKNSVTIAKAIETVINPDGLGVYQLNKPAAGQTVFHYHMHLIPKSTGEDIGIHSKSAGDPEELASLIEQFKAVLK